MRALKSMPEELLMMSSSGIQVGSSDQVDEALISWKSLKMHQIGIDESNRNGGRRIGMEDDGVNNLQHGMEEGWPEDHCPPKGGRR
jgi:predicted transcriptional regulator